MCQQVVDCKFLTNVAFIGVIRCDMKKKSMLTIIALSEFVAVIMGGLHNSSRSAEVVRDTSLDQVFNCEKIGHPEVPYVCSLNNGSMFIGIQLGMERREAFEKLLTIGHSLIWAVVGKHMSVYMKPIVGLRSQDWQMYKENDRWALRDYGFPCVGFRYINIEISQGKVHYLNVHCRNVVTN